MEMTQASVAGGGKQLGGSGRPPRDRREVLKGIFYVNHTVCPLRHLPKSFDHGNTVYRDFNR
jgi:transposase